MKRQIASIIIGIALLASYQSTAQELVNCTTFSQSETTELLNLIEKFDRAICEIQGIEVDGVEVCYDSFARRIWSEVEEGHYNIGITQEQQDEILAELSAETIIKLSL